MSAEAARRLGAVLTVCLATTLAACGESEGASEGSAEEVQPAITDAELGEIDRQDIELAIRWTTNPITGEAQADASPARTVSDVRFSRIPGVDRMTVEFREDATIPSYEVQSSVRPFPYCMGADSIRSEGPGLLRIRLPRVTVDSALAAPSDPVSDLGNVTAVHLACHRDAEVEWVLDVERATSYRMLHLSNPTRLVLDVRQNSDGSPAPAESGPDGGSGESAEAGS